MSTLKKHSKHEYDLYGDVEKIKAALIEATQDVKGKTAEILSESIDDAKRKVYDISDDVSEYVSNKPLKSLGASLLVGVAIGYLLKR